MEIDFSSYKNGLSCFVGNSALVNPIFTDEEAMEWMVGRVEKAEAVKESLINVLSQFVEAYHKGLIGSVPDVPPAFVLDSPGHPPSPFITRNLLEEMVRKAETALRTAEESSVVVGERYCHSKYGSANCKWEPGIGCTPKCPECIP